MSVIGRLKPYNKMFEFFVICDIKICNISNIIVYIFIMTCVVFIKVNSLKNWGPLPKLPGPLAALDCNMQNHANCCLMLNIVTHCL